MTAKTLLYLFTNGTYKPISLGNRQRQTAVEGYWERYFSKYNKGTVLVGGGGGNYDNNNNNSKVVFKTHPQEKGRSSKTKTHTHIHTPKKKEKKRACNGAFSMASGGPTTTS